MSAATQPIASTEYDTRHGGPYDRGGADFCYHRRPDPHYFTAGSLVSHKITDLTPEERDAYQAGYEDAYEIGDRKDWS